MLSSISTNLFVGSLSVSTDWGTDTYLFPQAAETNKAVKQNREKGRSSL